MAYSQCRWNEERLKGSTLRPRIPMSGRRRSVGRATFADRNRNFLLEKRQPTHPAALKAHSSVLVQTASYNPSKRPRLPRSHFSISVASHWMLSSTKTSIGKRRQTRRIYFCRHVVVVHPFGTHVFDVDILQLFRSNFLQPCETAYGVVDQHGVFEHRRTIEPCLSRL